MNSRTPETVPGAARAALLAEIADRVPAAPPGRGVRVAVDGVDGVGKSVFAAELAAALRTRGRHVVAVSADDFHHRKDVRYRRGRDSPDGFWLDSYDYPMLIRYVLGPFGGEGSPRYRPAAHDLATDQSLDLPWRTAAAGTVLVVDGLFLHRDELAGCWEFSVFLDAPFEVTVARMAGRDGTHPDPDHPSVARYVGGQRRYLAACEPRSRATVVVDNTDLARPVIVTTQDAG